MVDLTGKPTCEVICPFDHCRKSLTLSITQQSNLYAPPKFNPYNFERHIENHLKGKRKALEDVTFSFNARKIAKRRGFSEFSMQTQGMITSTPKRLALNSLESAIDPNDDNSSLLQIQSHDVSSVASTIHFSNLASNLDSKQSYHTSYKEELESKIRELEAANALLQQQRQQQHQQKPMQQQLQQGETEKAVLQEQQQQSSSKIEALEIKIQKLEAENVSLQQKQ